MTHASLKLAALLLATLTLSSTILADQAQDAPTCEGFNERWSTLINTSRAECDLGAIESIATQEDYATFCETCDTYNRFHRLYAGWSAWADATGVEAPCTAEHPSTGEMQPARELLRHFRHNLTGICLQASDEYCHPELAELKHFMFDAVETFAHHHEKKFINHSDADNHPRRNRSEHEHQFEFEQPRPMDDHTRRNRSGEDLKELVSDRLLALANRSSFNLTYERERVCASPCTRVAAAFARYVKAKIDGARRGPGAHTGGGPGDHEGERGMQERMGGEEGERMQGGERVERTGGEGGDREARMGGEGPGASSGEDRGEREGEGKPGPRSEDSEIEGMFEDRELSKLVAFTNAYCNSNVTALQLLTLGRPEGQGGEKGRGSGDKPGRVLRMGLFLGFGSEQFTAERQAAVRWAIASGVLRDRELDVERVAITSTEDLEVEENARRLLSGTKQHRLRVQMEVEMPDGVSKEDIRDPDEVNAKANAELANLGMGDLAVDVTAIDATEIGEASTGQFTDPSDSADADTIQDAKEGGGKSPLVVIVACVGAGVLLLAGAAIVVGRRGRVEGQRVQAAKPAASAPEAAKDDLVYGLQLASAPVGVPTSAPPHSMTALEAVQSKV